MADRMRGLFVGLLLSWAGCSPTFDDGHLLDELRILAVRADPPEVSVGDTVEVQALVVTSQSLPVTTNIWQCPARGGMSQGCETFDDAVDLGPGPLGTLVIGPDWRTRLDRIGLPVHQVVTVVSSASGDVERAIKRIVVSDAAEKNHNPALDALLLGEETEESGTFVAGPGQRIGIHPMVAEGSAEAYDKLTLAGGLVPTIEEFFVSYYYTCGQAPSLDSGTAEELGGTFQAPREPGRCSLYAILRDDRGGVDWRVRDILVEE